MERIIMNDVTKSFDDQMILDHISYSFGDGVYYITGENGSGKSTLLKIMMGLILPDEGSLSVLGCDVAQLNDDTKRKIGFMFASDRSLYYRLTAYENLYMVGRIYGMTKKQLQSKIPELLSFVGLENNKKYIETYSTGMKKRLMFARSVLYDPVVLFMDEPFSGVDENGEEEFVQFISGLKDKTVILVTHDLDHIPEDWIHLELKDGKLCTGS